MSNKITKISFGESVKEWSYKRFITHFRPIFPDANLERYAEQLGIKKPVAMFDKPEGAGRKKRAPSKIKNNDQDTSGSKTDRTDQRPGAGQGEHEADEEGLR